MLADELAGVRKWVYDETTPLSTGSLDFYYCCDSCFTGEFRLLHFGLVVAIGHLGNCCAALGAQTTATRSRASRHKQQPDLRLTFTRLWNSQLHH